MSQTDIICSGESEEKLVFPIKSVFSLSEFEFSRKSICGTGHHPSRDLTIAILRMSRIVVRFDPRSINVGRVDLSMRRTKFRDRLPKASARARDDNRTESCPSFRVFFLTNRIRIGREVYLCRALPG